MNPRHLPVIEYLEKRGGDCLLRELSYFSSQLLSEMEQEGRIVIASTPRKTS
jgi:hypothetical protein